MFFEFSKIINQLDFKQDNIVNLIYHWQLCTKYVSALIYKVETQFMI